jgi:hypothetical protein
LPSGGIGSFAAASTDRWAGYNTLFDDGGGNYHYAPEAFFKGLTDRHLQFRFGVYANSQLGKSRGRTTVGSGGSIDGSLNYHALVPCVWQDDGSTNAQTSDATELQTSGGGGIAIELNGAGVIVGQDYNKGASLWTPNGDGTYQLLDLNSTLAPGSGWHLTKATYITDSGDIFGVGEYQGQARAFHLTPLPEPATILALGAGILGLLRRKPISR